jgi:hypothetical protein
MDKAFGSIQLGVGTISIVATAGATATVIGFTRGAEFNDNYTTRNIEVDGRVSPLLGEKVVESTEPTLTVNALQISSANLDLLFSGITVATVSSDKTVTRSHALTDADYLASVVYTGTTNAGKSVEITLSNCLANAPMNFVFEDQAEVEIPVTFIAHNTITANTTLPYQIKFVAEA